MIEIPEAINISRQINEILCGKQIIRVEANASQHKFAWFYKDPQAYSRKLIGKKVSSATAYAGLVEISVEGVKILLGDGVSLKYYEKGEKLPLKHQLLLEFDDMSSLTASIQMYGGIWCFDDNEEFDNMYYRIAKDSISPLDQRYNWELFDEIINKEEYQRLSAKAFLGTEQRIPGLGNGSLQDILWNAKIHPKRKINSLSNDEKRNLFNSIKEILEQMVRNGGRDTEKDLFGRPCGYITKMSKNNSGKKCEICDGLIHKESYLGGSIYYCDKCQILPGK